MGGTCKKRGSENGDKTVEMRKEDLEDLTLAKDIERKRDKGIYRVTYLTSKCKI